MSEEELHTRQLWPWYVGGPEHGRRIPAPSLASAPQVIEVPYPDERPKARYDHVLARLPGPHPTTRLMVYGYVFIGRNTSDDRSRELRDEMAVWAVNVRRMFYEPENPTAPRAVWVCGLCGQPLGENGRCNSGLHVGPSGGEEGRAMKSTTVVDRMRRAEDAEESISELQESVTQLQSERNLTQGELDSIAECLGLPKDGTHLAAADRIGEWRDALHAALDALVNRRPDGALYRGTIAQIAKLGFDVDITRED